MLVWSQRGPRLGGAIMAACLVALGACVVSAAAATTAAAASSLPSSSSASSSAAAAAAALATTAARSAGNSSDDLHGACNHLGKRADACWFVEHNDNCLDDVQLMNYLALPYCVMPGAKPLAAVVLVLWLLVLFVALGVAAEDYFCPSLTIISEVLHLSPNVAGVTFLALGNGAPDIFSVIAAVSADKSQMAIGELFGAGVFVTLVIMGVISLMMPFTLTRRPFLRDVVFYIGATVWTYFVLVDGSISLGESIGFIILYVVYVVVVVGGRAIYLRQKRRRLHRKGGGGRGGGDDEAADGCPPKRRSSCSSNSSSRGKCDGCCSARHSGGASGCCGGGCSSPPSTTKGGAAGATGSAPVATPGLHFQPPSRSNSIAGTLPDGGEKASLARQPEQQQQQQRRRYGSINNEEAAAAKMAEAATAAPADAAAADAVAGAADSNSDAMRAARVRQRLLDVVHEGQQGWRRSRSPSPCSDVERGATGGGEDVPAGADSDDADDDDYDCGVAGALAVRRAERSPLLVPSPYLSPLLRSPRSPRAVRKEALAAEALLAEAAGGDGEPPRAYSAWRALWQGVVPVDFVPGRWKGKRWYGRAFAVLKAPIVVCYNLTVPVLDWDEPDHAWNRPLNTLHCVTMPIFTLWVTGAIGAQAGHMPVWVIVLAAGLGIALVVWVTSGYPRADVAAAAAGILDADACAQAAKAQQKQRQVVSAAASPAGAACARLKRDEMNSDATAAAAAAATTTSTVAASSLGAGEYPCASREWLARKAQDAPPVPPPSPSVFARPAGLVGVGGGHGAGGGAGDMLTAGQLLLLPPPPPRYHLLFTFLGFTSAVLWIYLVANEIVSLLLALGRMSGVSYAILGLTVLALGNSIGDMVADVTMARAGFAQMAVGGVYGGPLMNVLLGIGIACTIANISRGADDPYGPLELTLHIKVSALFLMISLVSALLYIPINKFRSSKAFGIYLLLLYAGFLGASLYVEFRK